MSASPPCFTSAVWFSEQQTLTILVNATNCNASQYLSGCRGDAACAALTVTVPSTAGLELPPLGTKANDASYTISSNAVSGPVLATPIPQSPRVG